MIDEMIQNLLAESEELKPKLEILRKRLEDKIVANTALPKSICQEERATGEKNLRRELRKKRILVPAPVRFLVSIIKLDEDIGEFIGCGSFDHPYPATKVMWIPDQKGAFPDLIATTGDYLRLWRVGGEGGAQIEVFLNNNRSSEYCAPLTSFDWNDVDVGLIGTSSIDTTCTIWQVEVNNLAFKRLQRTDDE
ncbi:unnamed protein product [Gongylonema pulchrum]|uniref:WD_REPEATS_REGION domain-containing protein n=1 Tax=Gongylonema pulchrum TaxID=637853 RepID=A0A183DZP4_9BILA|nr:unnamed protein product [Gongylonema pulchrum]